MKVSRKTKILIRVLSEKRLSAYVGTFVSRLKMSLKLLISTKIKINKSLNDRRFFNKDILYVYIKDYGHLLRFNEFIKAYSGLSEKYEIYVISLGRYGALVEGKKEWIRFSSKIYIKEFLILIFLLGNYIFRSNFKSLLRALSIYYSGIASLLEENFYTEAKNHKRKNILLSFNDQPIQISMLEILMKENNLIEKSYCYQHGIIGAPQYYFPAKSDFFLSYTENKFINEYFSCHNKYKSEIIAVGNLKYINGFISLKEVAEIKNIVVIMGPYWNHFLNTLNTVSKSDFSVTVKIHPGMKFKFFAELILSIKGFRVAECEISLKDFDFVVAEVSTVLFEAVAEGLPIGILTGLNFDIPYYLQDESLPKILEISKVSLDMALQHCEKNKMRLLDIVFYYFGSPEMDKFSTLD